MIKLAAIIDERTITDINTRADVAKPEAVSDSIKGLILGTPGTTPPNPGILTAYILPTAFFLVIAFGVYGGILYITAYGNEEKATKGKNTITWSIIGAIVIILAFVIVRFVSITLLGAPAGEVNPSLKP